MILLVSFLEFSIPWELWLWWRSVFWCLNSTCAPLGLISQQFYKALFPCKHDLLLPSHSAHGYDGQLSEDWRKDKMCDGLRGIEPWWRCGWTDVFCLVTRWPDQPLEDLDGMVDVSSGTAYFIQENPKEQSWIILISQHWKIILVYLAILPPYSVSLMLQIVFSLLWVW